MRSRRMTVAVVVAALGLAACTPGSDQPSGGSSPSASALCPNTLANAPRARWAMRWRFAQAKFAAAAIAAR